jgi:F-type H+-transporting ATPase subunit a
MRRLLAALTALALAAPAEASAGEFDPSKEFELKAWVPIHLGPLDLSINKAVVYLFIGTALTCLLGIGLMRWRLRPVPGRRETIGELIYDIAQTQVAEMGLPSKAIKLWFPYVATLLLFIWSLNVISFVPLPLTGETWHGIPVFGIYAATSSLSVTRASAGTGRSSTSVPGSRPCRRRCCR